MNEDDKKEKEVWLRVRTVELALANNSQVQQPVEKLLADAAAILKFIKEGE